MDAVGGGGRRALDVVHGVVAEGDRRPDHPAGLDRLARYGAALRLGHRAVGVVEAFLPPAGGDEATHLRVAVDGLGLEIAAEGRLRIEAEDREMQIAAKAHHQGPVIGDELGKERGDEQHEEHHQRPEGPAIGAEVPPAAPVQRRHLSPPARKSRCAGRSRHTSGPTAARAGARSAQRHRAWRTSPDNPAPPPHRTPAAPARRARRSSR